MIRLTTRERVDAYWSSTLGVDASDLHIPGTRVRLHPPDRATWRGVYVLCLDKAAWVFVPTDLLDRVAPVTDLDAEAVLEPDTWNELLGPAATSTFGPVLHHYRDERDGLDEVAAGRRINPRDFEALGVLRGAIASDEWASAGFTGQPAMLFGLFEGERMMAAANLNAGPDAATDIGIVVHPEARGKGYGLAITAAAAKQALLMHGVARFRAHVRSESSRALAQRLGFTEYGRNLVVNLA
jgi:GNAT superfamily N-acetyltransferase